MRHVLILERKKDCPMTVLVTGASGHIGGNLVRALLDRGTEVRALVRNDTRALDGLDVDRAPGDVLDPKSVNNAMRGAQAVFHLAGLISVDGDRQGLMKQTNIQGTGNVVDACLGTGVKRLVHFSSIHALASQPEDETIDETRPLVRGSSMLAYDLTKARSEDEVQRGVKEGLDAVIVNPGAVIGPFDFKPSPMGEVILNLLKRRMPALVGGGFNWVDVRDVVKGAIAAMEKGRTGERYLLTGHWLSVVDLAKIVEEVSGVKRPGFVSPMWLAGVGAPFVTAFSRMTRKRPLYTSESLKVLRHHRHITHAKAEKELGYKPRPTRETVEDIVAWLKRAGMI
jgi:dihydroflavonol-4-reductase